MDDTDDKVDAEKEKARRAAADLSNASVKLRNWYVNYVLSDFTFAAISTAMLAMIKIYLNLNWTSFWNSMVLFYVVFISTMVSRLTKVLSAYYEEKTKNLRRF